MSLAGAADFLGLSSPAEPIYPELPRNVQAFQNKYAFQGTWSPLAGIFPQLPEDVRAAIIRTDQERIQRGSRPIPVEDTAAVAATLVTGQPFTKPPRNPNPITDLPNAIFRDIRDIARSIPKLPLQLFREAQELGRFPAEYAEQLERLGNPVAALAASPGVRLLPGAYAVENVAGGTPGELLRHPVFAALDVAPYAGRAGRAVAATPAIQVRAGQIRASEPYRRLAASNVATKTREAFGGQAREASYMFNTGLARLGDWTNPARPVPEELFVSNPQMAQELQIAKDTRATMDKYNDLDPARVGEITRAVQLDALDSIPDLTDVERAFVGEYKDVQKRWQEYALTRTDITDSLREVLDPITGTTEVFPSKQANRILAGRAVAQFYGDYAGLRRAATEGTTVNGVLDTVAPYLGTDVVADVARRRAIITAGANTLEGLGLRREARALKGVATDLFQRKNPDVARTNFDALRRADPDDLPVSPITKESLLASLPNVPQLARARTLIEGGAWASARKSIAGVLSSKNRPTELVPALNQLSDDLRAINRRDKFIERTKEYSDKRAAQLRRRAEQRYRRTLPARYQPLVEERVKGRLVDTLQALPDLDDATRNRLVNDVIERNFTNLSEAGIERNDVRRIQSQVAKTWVDMKAEGLDPVYVHRVSPDVAHIINFPTIRAQITTPSQVKSRTMDATPHYDNLNIALNHQALEWLTRRGIEEFVDNVISKWGVGHDELYNRYVPFARQRFALRGDLDINSHVNKLLNQEWTKFDATARFPWMKGRVTGMPKDEMYVPKVVANTVDRFFNDNPGLFSQLSAPFMNGFRASVLTLSPRWHVYNILGGMVMMMARTNPLTVWQHMGAARTMLQNPERVPDLLRGELGKAKLTQQEFGYTRGVRMSEFWQQAKERSPVLDKAAEGFNRLTDKSWTFNQWVDDMYRAMSYLYGYDKELTRGMSKDQAVRAGVELSRKIMPDWNSMTPIERNVIRSVFPFYGFMSHVLRYVYKYPIDHPVRASILANFARAELEDMEEATPTKFMDIFAFGDIDAEGNRKAFSFAGLNPFSGASDLFTMAGFLSQVNPLLATIMEQAGLVRGTADMTPDVRFDPDTGRLALQSRNPLANLLAHTLPQVSLLTELANPTSRLNRLRATDPDVSEGIIRGALGFPRLFVDFNESDEQLRAELNRREDVALKRAEALKTGIDVQARRYPLLSSYFSQLRQLQSSNPDMFTAYSPGTYTDQLGIEQTPGVTAIGTAQRVMLGSLIGRG